VFVLAKLGRHAEDKQSSLLGALDEYGGRFFIQNTLVSLKLMMGPIKLECSEYGPRCCIQNTSDSS
jgi:hypothetical protein